VFAFLLLAEAVQHDEGRPALPRFAAAGTLPTPDSRKPSDAKVTFSSLTWLS